MLGNRRIPNISFCPCRIHLELDFDTSCNRHIVDLRVGLQLGRTGYTNSGYPKGHDHDIQLDDGDDGDDFPPPGRNFPGRFLLPESFSDRKSTRLNSSHITRSRMPSSA